MGIEPRETIAAMATAPGEAGIGIIRVSGTHALEVADAVFVAANGSHPSTFRSFTARYGWVRRQSGDREETVDEALLTVMRAPRSYTREDIVEISCHGGPAAMRSVLELVLENGCRLAEPGEFTKRAFLNGRIDLTQAEAVLEVIKARTDKALAAGIGQLGGKLSKDLDRIRAILVEQSALLEAAIDFPEDAGYTPGNQALAEGLGRVSSMLAQLLEGAAAGRIYREGISCVICGRPNAGKSSLLNALLKEERSIVTPVAGTTRDAIEECVDIKGIPVRIVDTAGIRGARGQVERKAMRQTLKRIASADLIVCVFDSSRKLSEEDKRLLKRFAPRKAIAVLNKTDLPSRADEGYIRERIPDTVALSAKHMTNIHALETAIARIAGCAESPAYALCGTIRQVQELKKIKKIIDETLKYRDNEVPADCLAQNLKDASVLLDRLQGRSFSEELLERIFSRFCIGK